MVHGEWGVDVCAAGEAAEADACVGHGIDHFVADQFGLGEAVGFDIGDAHAAGEVEGDEQVAAEGFFGAGSGIALGAGERGDDRGAGGEEEEQGEPAGQRAGAFEDGGAEARGDEGVPLFAAEPGHGECGRSEQGEQDEQDQPCGLGEFHRIRRKEAG